MRFGFALLLALAVLAGPLRAGEVITDLPAQLHPGEKYLFYLHGVSVELDGADHYSRHFQKTYGTTAIARPFAERGFTVITEIRPKGTTDRRHRPCQRRFHRTGGG
jgi:hypothetical protein